MENGDRGVVMTGPNTGGKTVAIKTVGLLVADGAMRACIFPAIAGSYIAMQDGYLVRYRRQPEHLPEPVHLFRTYDQRNPYS